jgi:hypothetical protein
MPLVKVSLVPEARRDVAQHSFAEFLKEEAGMDSSEAKQAAADLIRGRSIEVYFDTGEDEAARAFSRKVRDRGLKGSIQSDAELEEGEQGEKRKSRVALAVVAGVLMFVIILQEPGYGIILLTVGLLSVGAYLIIRARDG